jgi:flagellar biosynthesis protein FliP
MLQYETAPKIIETLTKKAESIRSFALILKFFIHVPLYKIVYRRSFLKTYRAQKNQIDGLTASTHNLNSIVKFHRVGKTGLRQKCLVYK